MTNSAASTGRLWPTAVGIAAASLLAAAPARAQWGYAEYGDEIFQAPSAYAVVGEGVSLSLLSGSDGPLLVLDTDLSPVEADNAASMLVLRIDRRRFNVPVTYVPSERLAYGRPGADLLSALMSGSTGTLRSNELGRYGFGLEGSSASIRQALAPCVAMAPAPVQGTARVASRDSLDGLRALLVAKLMPDCSKMGGQRIAFEPQAFRVEGGQVTVDYHHITCPGAMGVLAELGAGNCGAAQCLQEVYAPVGDGYALVRSYWQ